MCGCRIMNIEIKVVQWSTRSCACSCVFLCVCVVCVYVDRWDQVQIAVQPLNPVSGLAQVAVS